LREAELIEQIQSIFARTGKANLVVPNGDDGAVFTYEKQVVACADVAVEGVHFRPKWSSLFEVGRKITAANLADICAMGGWPNFLLVTVVLPEKYLSNALDLAKGIAYEADLVGAQVIGGDLSTGAELSISITALGETTKPLLRSGAVVGDSVYISSLPGFSAAGLYLLSNEKKIDSEIATRAIAQHTSPTIDYEKYRSSYEKLNCAIDISDGLVSDAGHIAKASGVRIDLDSKVLRTSELQQIDDARYLDWVLNGGEDHALFGTSSEYVAGFIRIGKIISGSGVTLDGNEIAAGGFTHSWR
jgi:thiamine-monophosphate kinase